MQLEAGAVGLTSAKLSEAEALLDAGVKAPFLVAQPLWACHEMRRLQLNEKMCIMSVDSPDLLQRIARRARADGCTYDVVVIVDTGYGRFGINPTAAVELALEAAATSGVRFAGIRSHAGQVYKLREEKARIAVSRNEVAEMNCVANRVRLHGVDVELVSIGSTPAHSTIGEIEMEGITEVRPGNYVFFDRMQVSLGVVRPERCALTVVTSVISTARGRVVVDAGRMTLSSSQDPFAPGYGMVQNEPSAQVIELSQECGLVSGLDVPMGRRIRIIPNHACEVTNLAPVVFYGRSDGVDGGWPVDARACVW
jgi:D-serine deaminase-like pyridoxal phosphate-dependent protein